MLTEHRYISEFNVRANGEIGVRKTIEVRRNDQVIGSEYFRIVLKPNDPETQAILGDEPYYLNLAQQAWATLPEEVVPVIPPASGN